MTNQEREQKLREFTESSLFRYAKVVVEKYDIMVLLSIIDELRAKLETLDRVNVDTIELADQTVNDLNQDIKKYKKALEFYAEENIYKAGWSGNRIEHDNGSIAREALK